MMEGAERTDVTRRSLIRSAWAAVGLAVFAGGSRDVEAHDLRPTDPAYRFDRYEAIVNRRVKIRQLYAWPNLKNHNLYGNVSNGLNGFQFSYDAPPDQTQFVVQAYFTAHGAMHHAHLWYKSPLGAALPVP